MLSGCEAQSNVKQMAMSWEHGLQKTRTTCRVKGQWNLAGCSPDFRPRLSDCGSESR